MDRKGRCILMCKAEGKNSVRINRKMLREYARIHICILTIIRKIHILTYQFHLEINF